MKDERILLTEQQYIEQNIQYRQSDFEGKTIIIVPEWVIEAMKSGRIT
jgi:hypothetical protein